MKNFNPVTIILTFCYNLIIHRNDNELKSNNNKILQQKYTNIKKMKHKVQHNFFLLFRFSEYCFYFLKGFYSRLLAKYLMNPRVNFKETTKKNNHWTFIYHWLSFRVSTIQEGRHSKHRLSRTLRVLQELRDWSLVFWAQNSLCKVFILNIAISFHHKFTKKKIYIKREE